MPAHWSAVIDPIAADTLPEGFRSWQWRRPHSLPSLGTLLHVRVTYPTEQRVEKASNFSFLDLAQDDRYSMAFAHLGTMHTRHDTRAYKGYSRRRSHNRLINGATHTEKKKLVPIGIRTHDHLVEK